MTEQEEIKEFHKRIGVRSGTSLVVATTLFVVLLGSVISAGVYLTLVSAFGL